MAQHRLFDGDHGIMSATPMNVIAIGNIGIQPNPTTKDSVAAQLALCDPSTPVYLDIHSQGGSVFEGFAIYNMIKEWSGKTIARIKTAAFSIASYIAMAADEVEIADNGFFMIHNPFDDQGGDDEELIKKAALLKDMRESMTNVYAEKTGMALATVQDMMKKESFIGAQQAISLGLADRVINTIAAQPLNYQLPEAVFVAMYRRAEGEIEPEHKETPMPEKTFATVKTIKAKFPKASSEFIVKCMEEEMTPDEVEQAHAKAMEEENVTLLDQVAALQAKVAALEAARAEAEPEVEPEPEPVAMFRPTGTRPVVTPAASSISDPRAAWDNLVSSFVAKGKSRPEALKAANKVNPGLRQRLVEVANL